MAAEVLYIYEKAFKTAREELSRAIYITETGTTAGIRAIYENKCEWLAKLICLAENGLEQKKEIEVTEWAYEQLKSRIRHLLQSDFIRSFDEWDQQKGDYKRDIKEADEIKTPTADVVEVETIKAWLNEMAINNVGCVIDGDFSNACEEIISRIDGLRNFAKERSEGDVDFVKVDETYFDRHHL